jgi:hypothetical protein
MGFGATNVAAQGCQIVLTQCAKTGKNFTKLPLIYHMTINVLK